MIRTRIAHAVAALAAVPLALALSLAVVPGHGDIRVLADGPTALQLDTGEESGIWGP
ncbi:hypothetical protein [Streptomyces sp. NBC_01320]|uniref:hypothetical protein n=1 Tax=Streptomyces sp. NBC_01320 TaxID=2903824 RepID=UPI002E0DA74F|nr:hypothetical protein OG395_23440 [Streptomyces sp. NBC_01320]